MKYICAYRQGTNIKIGVFVYLLSLGEKISKRKEYTVSFFPNMIILLFVILPIKIIKSYVH